MANPPQAAMKAPSGPRNPQIFTDAAFARASPEKVVCRIRYAHDSPVSTAPNWIAICAGVQNVSRPIPVCQEMSQYKPNVVDVTARAADQTYQGTDVTRAADHSLAPADVGIGRRTLSAIQTPQVGKSSKRAGRLKATSSRRDRRSSLLIARCEARAGTLVAEAIARRLHTLIVALLWLSRARSVCGRRHVAVRRA